MNETLISDAPSAFLSIFSNSTLTTLTIRIDDTISAKLQACCLNFNRAIKDIAGRQYGLDRELNFSLQFSAIERQQRDILLKETGIPAHIQTAQTTFEDALADEMIRNPHYSYRVIVLCAVRSWK